MIKKRIRKVKKTLTEDGVVFKSPLELFAYRTLKQAGIKFGYETRTFILQEDFTFPNPTYRRVGTGKKKRMVYVETQSIKQVSHRPDFVGTNWLLETKGVIRPENILRIKMLKKYIFDNNLKLCYFMAHSQKEVKEVIELIKKL